MLMVGFLTHNDSDILRAKTGPYRRVGYQTNIPPTAGSVAAARKMMGEGQVFSHQGTVTFFKGLAIPGYGGVSRIPLLHRHTLPVCTVASNICMRHSNVQLV